MPFWVILEFFDFLEPDFHELIFEKIDTKNLELTVQQLQIVLQCKPYETKFFITFFTYPRVIHKVEIETFPLDFSTL